MDAMVRIGFLIFKLFGLVLRGGNLSFSQGDLRINGFGVVFEITLDE